MCLKLELVSESKLYHLLPGRKASSRLEASGVALVDDTTALVVFDNLNQIARIDLSLKQSNRNEWLPAPSLGMGFEDITVDNRSGHIFCVIEAVEDVDGHLRGFIAEYDSACHFLRCTRLDPKLKKENKGFEGLQHLRRDDHEYLYALREPSHEKGSTHGGGRIDVFGRAQDGGWEPSHSIRLPKTAAFEDYAALTYRFQMLAVVSQASSRLWVARIDENNHTVIPDSDAVYQFPSKRYGNVEGIAWLTQDTLVAVSDRAKPDQPERSAEKDQSIHIFRIPAK